MRRNFLLIIVPVLLVLHGRVANARVAPTTLKELVAHSEVIVVGKVEELRTIDGVRFARVSVSRQLKGAKTSEVIVHAQPRWMCDESTAIEGETAIFMLNGPEKRDSPGT